MSAIEHGASFMLVNAASRTAMDLGGGSRNNGAPINGYKMIVNTREPAQPNQIWKMELFEKYDNNLWWCKLQNEAGKTYLDLPGGEAKNGLQLQGYEGFAGGNQQWLFWPVKGDHALTYVLYNRTCYDRKQWFCVDLDGGKEANNTKIQGFTSTGNPGDNLNQVWMLVKVSK